MGPCPHSSHSTFTPISDCSFPQKGQVINSGYSGSFIFFKIPLSLADPSMAGHREYTRLARGTDRRGK